MLNDSSNGNVVEKYSYDPWGAVTGANANSQRFNSIYYRGYYYDIDDSRYYLQSRYYKHQWGSFINADLPEIAQQSKNEVNGLNLFTYCNNDPVNNVDPTGYSKKSISLLLIYQNIFKGTANWTVHQYNWNKKRIIVTKDKFDRFLTLKELLNTVSKRWGLKIW